MAPTTHKLTDADAAALVALAVAFTAAGFGAWPLGEVARRVEGAMAARAEVSA